jgi:hypothetical protein
LNSNGFEVTVAPEFVLEAGVQVWVLPTHACTGAVTLNVSGTGAKSVVTRTGAALVSGNIAANTLFGVVYDGTSWRCITPIP